MAKNLTSVLGNVMLGLQIKLGKGDWIMERKEILKRAQDENLDERELQVKDKSMKWSYIVMVIMASVFSFIRSSSSELSFFLLFDQNKVYL